MVKHWRTRAGVDIAYAMIQGKSPTVVFLGGYHSDMTGTKATFLNDWCCDQGYAFLRFDYSGHGESSGDFEDGTLGCWITDACNVIEATTTGPLILVGSSMGGWIMLHVALKMKARVVGLVGIAAAPDFTRDLMCQELTADQRNALQRDGQIVVESAYDEMGYVVTRKFLDDGEKYLLLDGTIDIGCPSILLHGMQDVEVPWETSIRLANALASQDVRVMLVKSGDHRLSSDQELALLGEHLLRLLGEIGVVV